MPARTEVEIEATPEQVWEALVTEQGREDWLQEPDREVIVEVVEAPSRLVWWELCWRSIPLSPGNARSSSSRS